MSVRAFLLSAALVHACCMGQCQAQVPLSVDTMFRIDADEVGVNSILPQPDGKVIILGSIQFQGSSSTTRLARLNSDGSRDLSFSESWFPGSKLVQWNDMVYVGGDQTVLRFHLNGEQDPTFIGMNSGPYFSSLQGGDYHVFQDGRLLMAGKHHVDDPVRGFSGLYDLIWFSNTGYLDTTRTHRRSTGTTSVIEPLANGQFLVYGSGSQYEGQPVGRIFRINADGSLDPSLQTGVNWGAALNFLPLDDGRFYATGIFRRSGFANDTLRLVRFLPNGALDPTFNNSIPFWTSIPIGFQLGSIPSNIMHWYNGNLLVMGDFQTVDGQPRRGICVIDSTGQLMDEFDGCGVGPYVYQTNTGSTTYGSIAGMAPDQNGHVYIYGAYHGYNDGTTNDSLQRFVTRLYGPDFTTAVSERPATETFAPYPNPTAGAVSFTYSPSKTGTRIVVQDLVGRVAQERKFPAYTEQFHLDLGGLAQGTYMLRLLQGERTLGVRQVVVQD